MTPDIVRATYVAALGVLRGVLNPQAYDRRIVKINFTSAPAGSAFTLYRGYQLDDSMVMTTTLIGRRNSYDADLSSGPILLHANEAATFVWSGSSVVAGLSCIARVESQWGVN